MKQRSREWFEARRGKFTSSEIHKLMGIKGLGKTGETYAFEKACEIVFGIDEDANFESFDMQRGTELESYAFEKFKSIMSLEFVEVETEGFVILNENTGTSPDGLVGKNDLVEIKCPRPNKFFNLLANGESAIDGNYIFQMQHQLMCTGRKVNYFFNYIIFNGVELYHTHIIKRDDKTINKMQERIKEATALRDKYVLQLSRNAKSQGLNKEIEILTQIN